MTQYISPSNTLHTVATIFNDSVVKTYNVLKQTHTEHAKPFIEKHLHTMLKKAVETHELPTIHAITQLLNHVNSHDFSGIPSLENTSSTLLESIYRNDDAEALKEFYLPIKSLYDEGDIEGLAIKLLQDAALYRAHKISKMLLTDTDLELTYLPDDLYKTAIAQDSVRISLEMFSIALHETYSETERTTTTLNFLENLISHDAIATFTAIMKNDAVRKVFESSDKPAYWAAENDSYEIMGYISSHYPSLMLQELARYKGTILDYLIEVAEENNSHNVLKQLLRIDSIYEAIDSGEKETVLDLVKLLETSNAKDEKGTLYMEAFLDHAIAGNQAEIAAALIKSDAMTYTTGLQYLASPINYEDEFQSSYMTDLMDKAIKADSEKIFRSFLELDRETTKIYTTEEGKTFLLNQIVTENASNIAQALLNSSTLRELFNPLENPDFKLYFILETDNVEDMKDFLSQSSIDQDDIEDIIPGILRHNAQKILESMIVEYNLSIPEEALLEYLNLAAQYDSKEIFEFLLEVNPQTFDLLLYRNMQNIDAYNAIRSALLEQDSSLSNYPDILLEIIGYNPALSKYADVRDQLIAIDPDLAQTSDPLKNLLSIISTHESYRTLHAFTSYMDEKGGDAAIDQLMDIAVEQHLMPVVHFLFSVHHEIDKLDNETTVLNTLSIPVKTADLEMLDTLLNHIAENSTTLHYLNIVETLIAQSVKYGQMASFIHLKSRLEDFDGTNIEVDLPLNEMGQNALHIALAHSQLSMFYELTSKYLTRQDLKEDALFCTDALDRNLLHYALDFPEAYSADLLNDLFVAFKTHEATNEKNIAGDTPLLIAAKKGYIDAFIVLLEHGADPTIHDISNNTVEYYINLLKDTNAQLAADFSEILEEYYIRSNSQEGVDKSVSSYASSDNDFNPNSALDDYGHSSFEMAFSNEESTLFGNFAETNLPTSGLKSKAAPHTEIDSGNLLHHTLRAMQAGEDPNALVDLIPYCGIEALNEQDAEGSTPLILAAKLGLPEAFSTLLDYCKSSMFLDYSNHGAIFYALHAYNTDEAIGSKFFEILKTHGLITQDLVDHIIASKAKNLETIPPSPSTISIGEQDDSIMDLLKTKNQDLHRRASDESIDSGHQDSVVRFEDDSDIGSPITTPHKMTVGCMGNLATFDAHYAVDNTA